MKISVKNSIECDVLDSQPGDTRKVIVRPGKYPVAGLNGIDYRIVVDGVSVLVKFLDARECG